MIKMVKQSWAVLAIGITLPHQIKNTAILLLTLTIFSCSSRQKLNTQSFIKGFRVNDWKKDSLCCDERRPELVKVLIENRVKLIGLKKNDLIKFLGRANIVGSKGKSYAYFIEKGTQCQNIHDKYRTDIQTKMLIVDLENDVVTDVHVIVP
ncbi:hypothetical protein [Mucilaginibacter ginsenosidivorax]|uniref:Uncharacterized protein n=1 Tax=Mucilaginibacter ginsenosidivorax TaxID=862126 RepID=A0A5B8VXC5_9SPHI|nr:hypothetical protein [Mucilaginibacter ginsenosidivorax]QEC75066.1 hypothetical protein FSB76_03545 [Mucilaginibacter ginsenosidivorax]